MKKTLTCLLILLVASSLTLTMAPNVSGQTSNVSILDNYTFYPDSLGYLVVIGEVQNVGSSVISNITLTGQITTDTLTAQGSCAVWGNYLLPGEKAPFYMEFYPEGQGTSWTGVTKSDIKLAVYNAPETSRYMCQNVQVVSSEATPTATGEYWVTAQVQNNGTQTAQGVLLVATFFNSDGNPVGSGYTNPVSTLAAGATTTIKVPCWDLNQTTVSPTQKITGYRLLVQVAAPLQSDGNIPVVSSNPTPIPAGSTGVSNTSQISGIEQTVVYAVVIAAVAVIAVAAILMIRKRKNGSAANDEAFEPAEHAKKTRRERRNQ